MYVYLKSELGLWTVGFYKPDGKWVACKALEVGANVYWGMDKTKYEKKETAKDRMELLTEMLSKNGWMLHEAAEWTEAKYHKEIQKLTDEEFKELYKTFSAVEKEAAE